ncbi:predicted protein [Chaetoceros tenuissimus]|uniref:Transmembrane protein n=1 Tax=Chaetoceros tenuissimus TaxID=426638 RepID=A0AAD3CRB7_9STRA|nr:predicted protein [Chaetoceros tenuissimus]
MKIVLCLCILAISASSATAGALCSNNNSLIFQYENVQRDCLWLRSASDEIRKELCAVDNISRSCNLSCGNCCSDNPFFRMLSDDKTLSCFDIGKDNELKSLHCETKYGSSDFKVKDQCPESCDYCLNTQDETNSGSDEDEINIMSATGDPNATSERKKKGRWVWPVFGSLLVILAVVGSAFGYKKYKERDAVKSQASKSKFAAMFAKSKKKEEKKEEKQDDVEQGFFSGFFSPQPKEETKEETGFFGGFFSQPPQEEVKKEEKQEEKKKFSNFFSKKNKNEI